jgi:hypothetical protein
MDVGPERCGQFIFQEEIPMNLSARMATLVLVASATWAVAQEAVLPAPKVLVIQREFTKPGKDGAHEKSEMKFVQAWAAAKQPTHYVAATSLSGRSRALFMMGFPSFEQWEKEYQAAEKSGVFEKMDPLLQADGELLSEFAQSVFLLDQEHSLKLGDAVHARYFEITQFHVKPGHRQEFLTVAKMYMDGMTKANTQAHWALYESYYGENNGGYWIAISPLKSLAEDDEGMNDDKKMADAMGPEEMKKIGEMTAACLESMQTNLFEINPRISFAADEWVKADPFWKAAPAGAH